MKPPLLLRIAGVLTVLYALGHLSGAPWTPGQGTETVGVVDAMKSVRFDAMGAARTYRDFYFGFGLMIGVMMVAEGVAFWLMGSLAKIEAHRLRPLIVTFTIAYAANAVLGWMYFFAIPVVFAVAIVLALGWAYIAARPIVSGST